MTRRTRRILAASAALVLLGAAFAAVRYLRSDRFRELVRSAVERRLAETTGLDARIARFELDVWHGRFRIAGLELHPPPGVMRPIELSVDEIVGRVRLLTLWRLDVEFAELHLRRPRLTLRIARDTSDAFDPEKILRALRRSLDIAAKRVTIEGGVLDLDNRRIPLDLSLDDVVCEIGYVRDPLAYKVHASYRNSRLSWAGRDFVYDFDARFAIHLAGIDVDSFEVREGGSRLGGNGWMREWHAPVLLLHADGRLAAEELAMVDRTLKEVHGKVDFSANLRWDPAGFRSMGRFWAERGGYRRAAVDSMRGLFEIEGAELRVREVEGKVGPGTFTGSGVFFLRAPPEVRHHFSASARGIPMREIARAVEVPGLALDNTVDAVAEIRWRKGLGDLELAGTMTLHGLPAIPGKPDAPRVALDGDAEFSYRAGVWNVPRATFVSPDTEIRASGHSATSFHVQVTTRRLAEPLRLVRNFSTQLRTLLDANPELVGAAGRYELDGDVLVEPSGEMGFEGGIRITDGHYRVYRADSLVASAVWSGSRLELRSLRVARGPESGEGNLTLELSKGGAVEGMTFQGTIKNVRSASLKELGIDPGLDVEGVLSGSGSVALAGGAWSGRGELRVDNGKLDGEPFDLVEARIELAGRTVRIAEGGAMRGGTRATFRGRIDLDRRALELAVILLGLPLREIPALRDADVAGTITGRGDLRGTLDHPTGRGTFELADLRYGTWELGRGTGTFELLEKVVHLRGSVRAELGGVTVDARLSTEPGFRGQATVELQDWNVERLSSASMPKFLEELSASVRGTIRLEGAFAEPAKLAARGELDGARFRIHDYELRSEGKIRFAAVGGRLDLAEARLVGEGSNLALAGMIPLDGRAGLDVRLEGSLNLRFLQHLESELRVSGGSGLNVRATGSIGNPQIVGVASLNNTRFEYGDFPFHLSAVHGNVVFSRNLARLENVEGTAASGTVRLNGALEHENAELRGINLQITARRARLSYPRDFRSTVDAELNLRGSGESQVLTGDVNVLRSEYVREFNLLEQLAARSVTPPGPVTTDPRLGRVALNVSIHSDEGLFIDNELTKLRGRMRLTLRGTPAYPSLTGRVEATEGEIFFRGNKFEILHASADFLDRNRINPVVDVRAESDVKSYRLLLDVSGNLDNLRFNVTSDPPMSTVDIVSLLTTGEKFEGARDSRRQAEITGLSAASILSESLTGVIGKRVQRIFGFESFRVDPFLAGDARDDPTARLTISQRLSKDITITFSRNLVKSEDQVVVIEYDATRNLSIIATRDDKGSFGLDFRFRKRFR